MAEVLVAYEGAVGWQSTEENIHKDLCRQKVPAAEKILSSDLLPSIMSDHAHAHLWLLDRLLKEIDQLVHNTLRRIDRGDHERIRIYRTQVKIVSKAADPLSKEDTLCSAVAFPEWMQHIDRVIKVRCLFC